jgi:hypothetical protein
MLRRIVDRESAKPNGRGQARAQRFHGTLVRLCVHRYTALLQNGIDAIRTS